MSARTPLGQALVDRGALGQEQLEQAEQMAHKRGLTLEKAAVALGADEAAVYRCVAGIAGLPFVDPRKAKVGDDLLATIPREKIEQERVLPVKLDGGVLWVAIDDPLKTWLADDLGFLAGCEVRCALAVRRVSSG